MPGWSGTPPSSLPVRASRATDPTADRCRRHCADALRRPAGSGRAAVAAGRRRRSGRPVAHGRRPTGWRRSENRSHPPACCAHDLLVIQVDHGAIVHLQPQRQVQHLRGIGDIEFAAKIGRDELVVRIGSEAHERAFIADSVAQRRGTGRPGAIVKVQPSPMAHGRPSRHPDIARLRPARSAAASAFPPGRNRPLARQR